MSTISVVNNGSTGGCDGKNGANAAHCTVGRDNDVVVLSGRTCWFTARIEDGG